MTPLVSVITLNWNRKKDLLRTLDSIRQQTYSPKEILMVDNGSTDGSVEAVRQQHPEVEIIELPQNLGVQGYNEGMTQARGEFVLLIDNDMDLLQSNTLERIVHYFASDPKLGAVALQVRDSSRVQLSPNNPKYWEEKGTTNGVTPAAPLTAAESHFESRSWIASADSFRNFLYTTVKSISPRASGMRGLTSVTSPLSPSAIVNRRWLAIPRSRRFTQPGIFSGTSGSITRPAWRSESHCTSFK